MGGGTPRLGMMWVCMYVCTVLDLLAMIGSPANLGSFYERGASSR